MPLFSILYFGLSWAFICFFTLFLLYNVTKKPEKNYSLSVSLITCNGNSNLMMKMRLRILSHLLRRGKTLLVLLIHLTKGTIQMNNDNNTLKLKI